MLAVGSLIDSTSAAFSFPYLMYDRAIISQMLAPISPYLDPNLEWQVPDEIRKSLHNAKEKPLTAGKVRKSGDSVFLSRARTF